MKPKVYFRADASASIGYGHFVRSLALAEMLRDDFDCTFFTQAPTAFQREEVEKVCRLVALPDDESRFGLFLDRLAGDEIVVLDNYFFTPEYEKAVKDKGCRLVVIAPSKPHHFADVVVNYVDTDRSHYSVETYTQIVAGLDWVILRAPFRAPAEDKVRPADSWVVSFGGTDPLSLTERVLSRLPDSGSKVTVLCTNRLPERRREAFVRSGVRVLVDLSAEEVAALFDETRYAVLSSSTVCVEALARGVTVFAGYYVENQIPFYRRLSEKGWIVSLGNLEEPGCLENLPERVVSNSSIQCFDSEIFSLQQERFLRLFRDLCK